MAGNLEALVQRLEKVTTRLESVSAGGGGGGSAASAEPSASVDGFDEIVNGALAKFLELSATVGGDVQEHAGLFAAVFSAQRGFLEIVAASKQPSQDVFVSLLGPTSQAISAVTDFREKNRRSKLFNHLSAVAEGIPALGWVTMAPKPAPYVKDMADAAQFYVNRVLKEYKDTDKTHVEWARALTAVFTELHTYVKKTHTTGPAWNPNGADAKAGSAPAAKPAAPAAAPKPAAPAASKPAGGAAVKSALFGELSKGGNVTAGLKKVDRSQMTHKNPDLRAASVVKASDIAPKAKTAAPKFGGAIKKKDPVFELQGKKWAVEFQDGNKEIVIADTEVKQTVYIYQCDNSTIQIKGKVNSITCDGCKKTAVVFDDAIATFEFINCKSMQVQVLGKVPTISVDKTDGAQVYLSKAAIDCQIFSAKSSEMNILVPPEGDGDFTEVPVPEQFKTVWDPKQKKLVTEPTDIAG